ncbi:hypothetical protein [uncultured Stenotrophomonas sp.]|uniref:hypothetical protein n=1 Tax=uncultured Stenotrophomonas sp. TaxID=165438 RepID=UPI0025854B98|nr:hypothetical protein [uncultured Stenotrophomonas sp.]
MNLEEYLNVSKAWLMDTMRAHDLAVAGARLMEDSIIQSRAAYPPIGDGPIFSHVQAGVGYAVPVTLFPSQQFMRAMWLVRDGDLEGDNIPIPSLSPTPERTGSIVCRGGIVAQFELWKQFALLRAYPSNGKAALKHGEKGRFSCADEQVMLSDVIDLRNALTHEPDLSTDPDAKALVEYTNKLHHLADWVHRIHEGGITNHWLASGLDRVKA